ncbi:hypothetical protein [Flavobacterium sp.]|jgi:hypothetical protein|uniref:hypothetical protein n=1 Tax=Flavobacterium sp. TaxID=239 RepID=UPI0037C12F35
MSFAASRFRKSRCIIWTATPSSDGYGDTYSVSHDAACQFITDGKLQRDNAGQEFMPSGVFSLGVHPKVGDYIKLIAADASVPSSLPVDAMQVRKVVAGTTLRGPADYLAYTG